MRTGHSDLIKQDKANLGFWLYLMTDLMIFASLFAAYMVLRNATAGGPSGKDLFEPGFVLAQTFLLLVSSFTSGMALLFLRHKRVQISLWLLGATIVLGCAFLAMELIEFGKLIGDGHSWQTSAYLSGFFTLVGTHGLHILLGLVWAFVLVWYAIKKGASSNAIRKFSLFTMFWHFLDVVWIFIFSIVYLMGVAA